MMNFFDHPLWIWFGIAIFFVILEIILGSFSFIWLALSAVVVSAVLWVWQGIAWHVQFFLFSVLSCMSLIFWHKYLKQYSSKSSPIILNKKIEQYRGKQYVLIEPISNGMGKIKIGDSVWQVTGPDLPLGRKVIVKGMMGTYLEVLPVEV